MSYFKSSVQSKNVEELKNHLVEFNLGGYLIEHVNYFLLFSVPHR